MVAKRSPLCGRVGDQRSKQPLPMPRDAGRAGCRDRRQVSLGCLELETSPGARLWIITRIEFNTRIVGCIQTPGSLAN